MYKRLPENLKKDLIERVRKGESLSSVCLEARVSRTIFYRWLKTYSSSTSTEKVDSIKHPKAFSKNLEGKIVKLSLSNPDWTVRQIATEAGVSVHGAWNVLNRKKLNTKKDRGLYREKHGKNLVKAIRVDVKHTIIQRYETGESVTELCNKFGISRTVFYRWLKRYQAQGRKEHALRSIRPEGDNHWKSKPEAREMILQIVIEHPEFSAHKLAAAIHARSGKKLLGVHGVHNLLTRLNLSRMSDRLIYSRTHTQAIFIPPVPSVINLPETPRYSFISHLPPPVQKFVTSYGLLTLTSFVISLFGIIYISTIYNAGSIGGAIGVTFAWLALILGTFFFVYSIKYYLTIAVVLSYSRKQENTSKDSHENTMQTFWGRLFGVEISVQNANKKIDTQSEKARYGLQHDLSSVTLERYPFVSIQLSTYNEKRVINRLLTAATSMDYPNYEVILADDSTDETIDIIKQWENHPRVKISRRLSRDGYKGGALREALKITESRAEFVLIFDADFIPYPDTITQFLKYFQYTAGSLDFTGTEVQGTRYKEEQDTALSTAPLHLTNSASVSNIAAVQGYQWHVLNKSENWITRGVRSEYSGSYVIERSGAEVYGGLKQISGSVYMIRRDVLQSIGWGTSITEDFELTLKLYSKGWKVVYTPYIQAPAEAVSTLKRLIRQRMRWAEGHSFNIKHMFTQLLFGQWVERGSLATLANSESRTQNSELNDYKVSKLESNSNNIILNSKLNSELSTLNSKSNKEFIPSPLTFMEKLEFLYLTPYYLQAAFFILGTIAWLISETIFQVRLPFWTEVWGWSLVLTNLFALPLMNLVGLFMEESEDKDYQGLLSFVALSYIVAPFQAYAAIKGFLEDKEGPWFRTPKTGRITDIFIPGRFARIFSGIFKGRPTSAIASAVIAKPIFANNQYLSLATANNLFNNFRIRKKQRRWVGNAFFAFVVVTLMAVTAFSPFIPIVSQTSANTFDFGMVSGLDKSVQKDNMQKEANQGDVNNKDEIIKNALSKEINSPRSIIKELKTGGNIEFIFHKEPRVRIKFNGSEIDYETMRIGDSVIDPEKSLIFKDKEVIYQEVLKGIDIKYTINNGLITEEFIVKNREASSRLGDIKQSLKTSGLNVISTNHESFGFFLPDGKEALKFSDPFVRDNKGEIFRDIKMSLKKKGLGGYELSKTLNKNLLSWMNAEIRSYPVSIDPSVVVSGGIADGETQFGSMQRKVAPMARSAGVKIDDAGDPGALRDSGSRLVRTSAGVLYAVINDTSDIEVYSSTDAVTWTEQDSADGPTDLDSSDEWAIAIDSSDDLHIVYVNNNNDEDIDYITFDTSSNQFGTDEQAIGIGSTGGQTQRGLDIALDSNNVPHVITCEYGGNNRIRYANRVGGSWNTDLNPDTGQGYNQASIAINEDDLPEIAYLGSTDGLVAEIGNANNATSFTEHIVDSGAITSIDIRGVDIEVDSSGNTWIVYVDETGATDYVTLVKHNDADGWTTWQTPTHNSNAGVEPTLSIADNNVYVVYADENADVAWDRYNGSWAGETVRRAGTFQDVRARSANNFHNFDHSIDLLYSDGTDIYWDSLLDNYYVFYNESGDISYKKSTDGGVQWNTAVTVDDADTDNYNPTLSVSNGIIHVFWVDDGGELIEGRRINTASSDAQGTLCQTGSQGTISSSFMPTIAKFSDTSIMLAYSDTSSDSEVDIFEITGLDGSCTVADRNPGNITFGSGVTAGDRPALVSIDSNTIDMVFQDGNLSYSRFEADLDEWVRNNLTIASVTHNVYSVASDGTTVWVLVADTTQNDDVLLYSCCTDDWATTTIDSDIGTTGDGKRSNLDIFCVTDTDCKIVYTDNIDSTGSQDLVFVDCDDATCSSPQSFTIDADLDGDTDGTTTVGNPAIFCTSTDDCKVVYQDNYDNAAPDAVFYDCDDADGAGDNIPCDDGATATITDTDIGGISTLSSFDIYCVSSTECAYVFFEDNNNDITFVDCETDECATASDIVTSIVDVGTTTVGPYASIYCPSVDTCKVVTHDVDAGSMVFVNCVDGASAANDESCIGITPDTLDASVGTTVLTVGVAVDCVGGETDCKVAYVDVTDGDLTFLDCNDTDCDSPSSTTDIDVTAKSSVSLSLNMHCISATDCKIAYINSDSSSNFIDCDDAACNSGSVILVPGTNVTKINLFCPASGNCKLVYQSDPASGDPSVALSECDSTNCYPTATDASDPWTGETEVEAVSLTYDSTNSDLYAHVIMDSSDQAYFKSTDATSISWGTEYSYNFTAGDLGQISATETAAGFAQIGISLRQGSNYEFSTLPENMWLISVFSPILIITSKKIKLKRKRKT